MKKVTHTEMGNLNSFEKRLKDVRTRLDISQKDLASKIHISREQYNFIETGARLADLNKLQLIADELNISIDYLLCRTNNIDIANTAISHKIGLSDKSIEILSKFRIKDGWQKDVLYGEHYNYQDFSTIINKIIENENFEVLIHFIRAYINSFQKEKLEKEILKKEFKENDLEFDDEESVYDVSKKDIYKFKIEDIFNNIMIDVTNQLKDSFSERWTLNEDKTKVVCKCKDGSEEIKLLKGYGGVKANGNTRTDKK